MWKWFLFLGVIAAQIAFALLLRNLDWVSIEQLIKISPLQCPLNNWFDIRCAFCGMTHAMFAFYKGEWGLALQYNFLVFALVGLVNGGVFLIEPLKKLSFETRRKGIIAVIIFGVVFMGVRNAVRY